MRKSELPSVLAVALVLLTYVTAFQVFTESRLLFSAGGTVLLILAVGFVGTAVPGLRRHPMVVWLLELLTGLGILVFALGGAIGQVGPFLTEAVGSAARSSLPMPDTHATWFALLLGTVLITLVIELFVRGLRLPALAMAPIAALYFTLAALPGGTATWLRFCLIVVGMLGILMADTHRRTARWRAGLLRDSGRGNDSATTILRMGGAATAVVIAISLTAGQLIPILPNINLVSTSGMIKPEDPRADLNSDLHQPQPRDLLTYRSSIPGGVYLRRAVLPVMDSYGFQASAVMAYEATGEQFELPKAPGMPDATVTRSTKIELLNSQQPYLPLPYAPTAINIKNRKLMFGKEDLVVFSKGETMLQSVSYGVQSAEINPTWEEARNAKAGVVDPMYTYLPTEFPSNLRDLAAELTKTAGSDMEKASLLQTYFRTKFTYSLDVTPFSTMNGYRRVEDFVLHDRIGYCEHFAVSMAAMARAVGIPSRVVIGYLGGTESTTDPGLFTVSTTNAHAWVELYFEEYGWLRFEPTPSAQAPSTPGWTQDLTAEPAPQPTPTPTPTVTSTTASAPTPTATPTATPGSGSSRFPWEAVAILAGLLLLGAILSLPRMVRQARRRASLGRRGHPELRVEAAWEEIRDTALDLGLGWEKVSPRAQTQRLRPHLGGPDAEGMHRLALLVERIRFGHGIDETGEDVGSLAGVVVQRMLTNATPRERSRATWLAPSLWISLGYAIRGWFRRGDTTRPRRAL